MHFYVSLFVLKVFGTGYIIQRNHEAACSNRTLAN